MRRCKTRLEKPCIRRTPIQGTGQIRVILYAKGDLHGATAAADAERGLSLLAEASRFPSGLHATLLT